jgi:hypothetical protein
MSARFRHSRENGNPEVFEIAGFRVALAIASLPGMTREEYAVNFGSKTVGNVFIYRTKKVRL